ncbi:hypothetical protein RHS01_01078 [Rhizoctonia solani]|uniref:Uncharacterized protein n=1 Tax=Rhizoctonia solani TaxID=456999 RepID=A0A8H7ILQ5_9AGAM|nr:hypothetical protein RHS01_01078 [Rhizoctonia solani]
MAEVERAPSVTEQVEDTKEATLPLTPVSDGDGFKHGDHEDHPNETPGPAEPAHEPEPEPSSESAEMDTPAENKKTAPASMSPAKPRASISTGARTRTTSLATGKVDSKAPAASASARKTSLAKTNQPTPAPASKRVSLTPSTATSSKPTGPGKTADMLVNPPSHPNSSYYRPSATAVAKAPTAKPTGKPTPHPALRFFPFPSAKDAKYEVFERELKEKNEEVLSLREQVKTLEENVTSLKESSKHALGSSELDKSKLQSLLEEAKKELNETLSNLDTKDFEYTELAARVQEFENTIAELRSANDVAKLEISALKEQHSTQGDLVAAAAIEHEALLKARADLEAIRVETEALTASHQASIEQFQIQIKETEAKLSAAEATISQLRSQISTFESEREELKNRISELEVEILEIREENEVDADNHAKELVKLKDAHSKELADAKSRLQADLEKIEMAHEEAVKKLEAAITAAGVEHTTKLDTALKEAQESAAESKKSALAALEEAHAKTVEVLQAQSSQELAEAKESHERSAALVAQEVENLKTELASQEDKYAAKVREVKVEHDKLVEDAYHRAKAIRSSHREELSHAEDTHREALESATKPLEKKINNLTVEANAARDDLAKAKNTISAQVTETKALQQQVSDLKQSLDKAASSSPKTTPSAEIESLRNELREMKDDYNALNDVYKSMQENYVATVNNHKLELEEAAKGRIEALETLKSKHEAEKAQFAEERASLLRKVEEERDRALSTLNSSRSPPVTPKHSRILSNGSRDNLERLHHANDARLTQLETEHKQAVAQLTINLMEIKDEKDRMSEEFGRRITELEDEKKQLGEELERKNMELSFQEEELNDTQDEVKQLQDELERLKAMTHEQAA